jgi:undecaprenyl-diphosphatase
VSDWGEYARPITPSIVERVTPASGSTELTVGRAAVLGGMQGPAELLPISSSAHLALLPWFAGWRWSTLDARTRKDLEVALHGGTAVALLVGQRRAIAAEVCGLDARRAAALALAAAIPAIAGFALERPIEQRLGGPRTIGAGLVGGAVAMVFADGRSHDRGREDLSPADGLTLGVAQALALFPGVSRTGATVAAARWRRFSRREANVLSRTVALPVILGAAAFRGSRMRRRRMTPEIQRALAAGSLAAFASALASQALLAAVDCDGPVWPYAAYRVALAGAVAVRLRRGGSIPP